MSRTKSKMEAYKNLQLDEAFFQKILQQEPEYLECAPDYDIYLLEQNVMPLLLQGLDALSRHVDKVSSGGLISGGGRAPFNPLTWLAQYMLRNHPGKVEDHRSPMYAGLHEQANVERGRRALLRKRPEFEDVWRKMQATKGRTPIQPEDLSVMLQTLDEKWNLNGTFAVKFPDFQSIFKDQADEVIFYDFWKWFQDFVSSHDIIRAAHFKEALARRQETERQERRLQEALAQHELAMGEVLEIRRTFQDQFDSISADVYTNDIITQITNKGLVIAGLQETEGSAPLQGVHIELILSLLDLWGFQTTPSNLWDAAALECWEQWIQAHGEKDAQVRVDSMNLRKMLDRDAFTDNLAKAYPLPLFDAAPFMQGCVEVKTLLEGHGAEGVLVEALDEASGQIRQLVLPPEYVEEVRLRLDEPGCAPILACVDGGGAHVTQVLPAGPTSGGS